MPAKLTTITFKADPAIDSLLRGISNRSEFIRTAILSAFNSLCPFCKGTGVLTPHKQEHWQKISKQVDTECRKCEIDPLGRQKIHP